MYGEHAMLPEPKTQQEALDALAAEAERELHLPYDATLEAVRTELRAAVRLWPAMHSAHEGHGIIAEEWLELCEHIFMKQKNRDLTKMRKEALQLAAMAIRFATEVCTEERGRR